MISLKEYIEKHEYLPLPAHPSGEMYICTGNHMWHISDIKLEYMSFLSDRLGELLNDFDKYYNMSDDFQFWKKQNEMDKEIQEIKHTLKLYLEK